MALGHNPFYMGRPRSQTDTRARAEAWCGAVRCDEIGSELTWFGLYNPGYVLGRPISGAQSTGLIWRVNSEYLFGFNSGLVFVTAPRFPPRNLVY